MKKPKPSREEWLSLEEVAEVLGVPWLTVWRWARDGDSRLPAYKTWAEGPRDQISYRFRKADVLVLREPPQSQDAILRSASGNPPLDASSGQCQGAWSAVDAAVTVQERVNEDQAEARDLAGVVQETAGPVTP